MKRSAPEDAPIKRESQEVAQDALENANAIDMEAQREMEQAPAPAPASSTPHGGMRTIPPDHLVTTPTTFTQRKLPSMRGRSPAEVAAHREATERRFGVSLSPAPKPPPGYGRRSAGSPFSPAPAAAPAAPAPAPAPETAPAPAPAPVSIPDPPAHLTATGTAPPIPAKPKLPNHRALSRVSDVFLMPYTHPLTKNEVLVVHKSTRIQTAMKKWGMGVKQVLETMDLICHQAYEIVHVGGDAMAYWTDNIKAEVEDRRMAPADTVSGLVTQWLTFASTDKLFAGLTCFGTCGSGPLNNVIEPVFHYLYRAERKQQEEANAKAQKKIDAWEAKHGEAVRKAEALHEKWIAYAQERANAVAQREKATYPNLVDASHKYDYADVAKELEALPRTEPTVDWVKQATDRTTRDVEDRSRLVYEERKRFVAESDDVPPYKLQLLLRNARTAMDEHNVWLRKEIARTKADQKELELKSRARMQHKKRVIWELGSLSVQRRNIQYAAEGAIGYALNELGRMHGCQTILPLPDWVPGEWYKAINERIKVVEKLRTDLEQRCSDFDKMVSYGSSGIDMIQNELEKLERAVARLPALDPQRGSGSDDDVPVCTGVVTREERDAKGWQQAEVLE